MDFSKLIRLAFVMMGIAVTCLAPKLVHACEVGLCDGDTVYVSRLFRSVMKGTVRGVTADGRVRVQYQYNSDTTPLYKIAEFKRSQIFVTEEGYQIGPYRIGDQVGIRTLRTGEVDGRVVGKDRSGRIMVRFKDDGPSSWNLLMSNYNITSAPDSGLMAFDSGSVYMVKPLEVSTGAAAVCNDLFEGR